MEQFAEWGLDNIAQEVWDEFGRGWTNDRFYAHVIEPQAYPLIGYPKAWTPGTSGVVTGEAILAIIANDEDIETHRGTLAGKFVLTAEVPDVQAMFEAPGRRYTDEQLAALASQPDPARRGAGGAGTELSRTDGWPSLSRRGWRRRSCY